MSGFQRLPNIRELQGILPKEGFIDFTGNTFNPVTLENEPSFNDQLEPNQKEENQTSDQTASSEFFIKEQDRWLPMANVARIMKEVLPSHAKISRESKICIQECVSEFISFITSGAVDRAQVEKRKVLNGEDILWAMHTLGFENYAATLKIYLAKYRENESLDAEERRIKEKERRKKRNQKKQKLLEDMGNYISSEVLEEEQKESFDNEESDQEYEESRSNSIVNLMAINDYSLQSDSNNDFSDAETDNEKDSNEKLVLY